MDADIALLPASGLYRMGVLLAPLGDAIIQFQLEIQSAPAVSQINSIAIRAIGADGSLSDVLQTKMNVPVSNEAFSTTFEELVIPADFSITGSEIITTVSLEADIKSTEFFCGQVTGDIPEFNLSLEGSSFGATTWQEQNQEAPLSCDAGVVGNGTQQVTVGGERPAQLVEPEGHTTEPLPLVVLLHGFGASGAAQDAYFGLSNRVASEEFLLILPNGTANSEGSQFWNATLCCDFENSGVDDVSYILGLIDEAVTMHGAIASEVHLIGHSNGGFMASRIACEAADKIASFVSFAGSSFVSADDCQPSEPVHKLHIHGTNDATIPFNGGDLGPGAQTLVDRWAGHNGCDASPIVGTAQDLITDLPGDETSVAVYENCDVGGDVELWTMENGSHIPMLREDFADRVLPFMLR